MALEDLNFKIKADVADPMAGLRKMNDALNVSDKLFKNAETSFATLGPIAHNTAAGLTTVQATAGKVATAFGTIKTTIEEINNQPLAINPGKIAEIGRASCRERESSPV